MENNFVFGQTFQLMASGIVLLALCLGFIFYLWSLKLVKRIELLITKMKQNIDQLESLSQSIYETAFLEMKREVRDLTLKQNKTNQKIGQSLNGEPLKQKIHSSDSEAIQFSHLEEKEKYQRISELIVDHLKDLLQEKEQVTAQELVYDLPNEYSLADIYQSLEEMKERNQVTWKDKRISPQSLLKLV